jgi:hypothetical protein
MRVVVLVLTLAACGGKRGPATVENRAAPPPKPACTEARVATIRAHLQTRWNTSPALIVRCTPGLFPTPGYFIEASDSNLLRRTGILAASDLAEIVRFTDEGQHMVATSIVDSATVDLDGDGIDEIVETWRRRAHGRMGTANWLAVRRIADRSLTRIAGPHTSVSHPDLGGCTAEVQLAGHTIVITVARSSGIPPSDCLSAGVHTFALDGNAIVEIDATRLSRR